MEPDADGTGSADDRLASLTATRDGGLADLQFLDISTTRLRENNTRTAEAPTESSKREDEADDSMNLSNRSPSSIHCMPPELLIHIFMLCLQDWPTYTPELQLSPMFLSNVCRTWRYVALSIPELWSSISVQATYRPWSVQNLSFIPAWIERSGSKPLSVSIHTGITNANLLEIPSLRILLDTIHRWQDVYISNLTVRQDEVLISAEAPMLKRFYCYSTCQRSLGEFKQLSFHRAPCLREFEWRVASRDDSNFDSVAFWHQLTSLTLDSSLSVGRMINILASSVNLIRCDLRVTRDPPAPLYTLPIIHLPHLASLCLSTSYQGLQNILDSMILPSLSSLTLSVHWPQNTSIAPLVISSLIDRSCCALEHLSLQSLHMSEDDVIRCLQLSTDSLLELRITDLKPFPITDRTFILLGHDSSSLSSMCFPRLRIIEISR